VLCPESEQHQEFGSGVAISQPLVAALWEMSCESLRIETEEDRI
jgi:hypothetical protein